MVAVAVDAVVAVEYLSPRFAQVPGSEDDAMAGLVGAAGHRRDAEESLVLLLDPSVLAARSGLAAAA